MSETLSITTAVDLTACSPGELAVLKKHAEHVEQVARSLRLGIERERQRRVRVALASGDWARETYGIAHCVRSIGEASVRALCGRKFSPDTQATEDPRLGRCRRCAELAAK